MKHKPFDSAEDHACFMMAYHLSEAAQHFENSFEMKSHNQNSVRAYLKNIDRSGFAASVAGDFIDGMHSLYQDD